MGEIKNDNFTFNCLKLFLGDKPVDLVWLNLLIGNELENYLGVSTS